MTRSSAAFLLLLAPIALLLPPFAAAQPPNRPYRLKSVDLKQRILWGAEARGGNGLGLAFGGQDQQGEEGAARTRWLSDGEWREIHEELREKNELQRRHGQVWALREEVKHAQARARHWYFEGLEPAAEAERVAAEVAPRVERVAAALARLLEELPSAAEDPYMAGQLRYARGRLQAAWELLRQPAEDAAFRARSLHGAQLELELAAEAFDAEPAPRALDCGAPARQGEEAPAPQSLVYDPHTRLFLLFGGDHLDYLTNDTWVFDPAARRWEQRHPGEAPPPRANGRLEPLGDGRVRLTGGYTYTSNTDYLGGPYRDLRDGPWIYDLRANRWSRETAAPSAEEGETSLAPAHARTYRAGALHPEHFFEGERPNAAAFAEWLAALPPNRWTPTHPPRRPQLNRDWGVARIDTRRDLLLRWSGGHSAHGGTDVPHFHFATNRWELPFPVEFPLGQLYANTEYPNGWNFNRRPWVTGHTYQNYAFDPPSGLLVKAGRPNHYYLYDPDRADWIDRGPKPEAMRYNSCFYTLTCIGTPEGVICWGGNGRVHRYDHAAGLWRELELSGDPLPGAYVDNSSIVYDSKRKRVLMLNTLGYQKPFDGTVWSLDPATGRVTAHQPAGKEQGARFATVDRSCYDPASDLLLLGTYLKEEGDHTATPAYDCAENRWVLLDLAYTTGERLGRARRDFPHGRSDALVHDPRRGLIWGCDTHGQVYVLRLERKSANVRPLE